MPLPELDEGPEHRGLHARQVLEGQVLLAGSLEFAGAEYSNGETVQDDLQHQARMVGGLAEVSVARFQGSQIHLVHQVIDQVSRVILIHEVLQTRGQ